MASARVFTTSGDKSPGSGVSPCAGSAEWLPSAVLIGCGTYGFVRLRTSNGSLSFVGLFYSRTGLCSPGGLHLKCGIM